MTRGARAKFNDDSPVAQVIAEELDARGWQLKDLAEALRAASGDRLRQAGADAVARRAIHGKELGRPNRELLEQVLGRRLPFWSDPPEDRIKKAVLEVLETAQFPRLERLEDALTRIEGAVARLEEAQALQGDRPPA